MKFLQQKLRFCTPKNVSINARVAGSCDSACGICSHVQSHI